MKEDEDEEEDATVIFLPIVGRYGQLFGGSTHIAVSITIAITITIAKSSSDPAEHGHPPGYPIFVNDVVEPSADTAFAEDD